MRLGDWAPPPAGFLAFCIREADHCGVDRQSVIGATDEVRLRQASDLASALRARFGAQVTRTATVDPPAVVPTPPVSSGVRMTPQLWARIVAVNSEVNRRLSPEDDIRLYGEADHWATPLRDGRASGDCEDYVLEKRRALISRGLAPNTLSIAVVRTDIGIDHAVLLVETRGQVLVLDNLTPSVRPWRETSYRWIMRQLPGQPLAWRAIQADGPPAASFAAERRRTK